MACKNEFKDVVEILLKYGAKSDVMMKNGKTPLMIVCDKGNIEIMKIFLKMDAGVDKNIIRSLIKTKSLDLQNDIMKCLNDNCKDNINEQINNEDVIYNDEDEKMKTDTCYINDGTKEEDAFQKCIKNSNIKNVTKICVNRDKRD